MNTMNIFVLDEDPSIVHYMLDKHIVKMPLETAQILCTVAVSKGFDAPYKPTHAKHPAVIWAGKSSANWNWLCEHGLALSKEYTFRYGKKHKCEAIIKSLQENTEKIWKENKPHTEHDPFVLCMPDQYKVSNPVESYRNYYRGDKAYIAKWTKRSIPNWW